MNTGRLECSRPWRKEGNGQKPGQRRTASGRKHEVVR